MGSRLAQLSMQSCSSRAGGPQQQVQDGAEALSVQQAAGPLYLLLGKELAQKQTQVKPCPQAMAPHRPAGLPDGYLLFQEHGVQALPFFPATHTLALCAVLKTQGCCPCPVLSQVSTLGHWGGGY